MKILAGAVLAFGLVTGTVAQSPTMPQAEVSSAQQKIAQAQAQIDKDPRRHQAYNQLAMALARRARETSEW